MSAAAPPVTRAGYALCADDRFWFRPAYTDGKCPLCGEYATGGVPELSWWARIDRMTIAMTALVVAAVAMTVLVLVTYYKA